MKKNNTILNKTVLFNTLFIISLQFSNHMTQGVSKKIEYIAVVLLQLSDHSVR